MVNLLFYIMALGAVASAVYVVVARSPIVSVMSLLGSFACLSVIYLLAGFQFLAAIQILVYGGAVMVLFLFVVMLLNLGDITVAESREEPLFHDKRKSSAGLCIAVAVGAAGLIGILRGARYLAELPEGHVVPVGGYDPLNGLAEQMFTRYSLPFEAASVLLLATAVGVLVLAKRERQLSKETFPSQLTGRPRGGGSDPAPSQQTPPAEDQKATPKQPEEVLS